MLLEEMGSDLAGMGFGFYGNEEDYMSANQGADIADEAANLLKNLDQVGKKQEENDEFHSHMDAVFRDINRG